MNEHLELYKLLEGALSDRFDDLYTSQPCTIQSFNDADNTLTVKLDHTGETIADVSIALLGSATNYITTPTMVLGTKGLLLFSKYDLLKWLETGTDLEPVANFSLNNAFFLTGVLTLDQAFTYNHVATEIKCQKLTIKNDTADLIRDIHDTVLELKKVVLALSTATCPPSAQLSCSADLVTSLTVLEPLITKIGSFNA